MNIPKFAQDRLVELWKRFGERRGWVHEYGAAMNWLESAGLIKCEATWNEPAPPGERQEWSVRLTQQGIEWMAVRAWNLCGMKPPKEFKR
jgi:hypothetical protein